MFQRGEHHARERAAWGSGGPEEEHSMVLGATQEALLGEEAPKIRAIQCTVGNPPRNCQQIRKGVFQAGRGKCQKRLGYKRARWVREDPSHPQNRPWCVGCQSREWGRGTPNQKDQRSCVLQRRAMADHHTRAQGPHSVGDT